MSVDYVTTDTIQTEATEELPYPVVEMRFADIFIRNPAAVTLFTGTADDIEGEENAAIVRAAFEIRDKKIPGGVNVANLSEILKIPEIELRKRALRARPDIMSEFETYAARVLAESYRRRLLDTLSLGHAQVARTQWRDMEKVGGNVTRLVGTISHASNKLGQNDVGNVLKRIRQKAQEGQIDVPLKLPWESINWALGDGLYRHKKLYLVAPPGSRKSTIIYNIMLHVGLNGGRYVHFALDGGSVEEQSVKLTVVLWYKLCKEHGVKEWATAQVPGGYSDIVFTDKRYARDLLYDRDPGFTIPPKAVELFWMAYDQIQALTRDGSAEGRLTFVSAKECRSDVYLMRSILNAELNGDGIDCWGFDHLGKLHGKSGDAMQGVRDVVLHLHTFADEEGPPMIGVSHMDKDSIRNIGQHRSGIMRFGAEAEQDADFMLLSLFDPKTPEALPISTPKNRDGGSENPILKIQPESGYIYEAESEF